MYGTSQIKPYSRAGMVIHKLLYIYIYNTKRLPDSSLTAEGLMVTTEGMIIIHKVVPCFHISRDLLFTKPKIKSKLLTSLKINSNHLTITVAIRLQDIIFQKVDNE